MNKLKMHFESKDKSTRTQYENLIDSLRHAYDKIPFWELEPKESKKEILDHSSLST